MYISLLLLICYDLADFISRHLNLEKLKHTDLYLRKCSQLYLKWQTSGNENFV